MSVCVGVFMCVFGFVPRALAKTIDFGIEGVCGGPVFAPPFTSAIVRSCFEFVALGDMSTGIAGSHHLVPHDKLYYIRMSV